MILRLYSPLVWFTVFAVLSSLLVPFVLAGQYQTAQAMDNSGTTPLTWGRMNVTQSIYIVVLTAFAIMVSVEVTGRRDAIRRAVNAFTVCGYLAGLIAAYHFASDRFGWYFPFDVFYSRPEARNLESYARVFLVGGITIQQVFGSFSEPSTLAQFMLGTTFGSGYWWLRGGAPRRIKGLAILSVATLLATVSTTAYAGLGVGSILLVGYLAVSGRLRVGSVVLGLMALGGAAALWAFGGNEFSGFRMLANNALDLVWFTKRDTISFQVRWLVDSVALDGFLGTYGLGLGWGSTRGSSLFIHLLGNVGAIGILLLTWFGWNIRRRVRGGVPGITGFVVAALCGNLLGGAIAVPDINSVALWFLVGLTVAAALTPATARTESTRSPIIIRSDTRAGYAVPIPSPYRFPVPMTQSEPQL
jgi:hypothetical protein